MLAFAQGFELLVTVANNNTLQMLVRLKQVIINDIIIITLFRFSACQEFHVFTDCRTLPVMYSFSDPSIFKLVEEKSKYKRLAFS